jgi:stage II sporulation protein GA (sporulation sigma-E factor processing peptidase)
MVYYIEYVFAENFLIDFILLFITGKLIKSDIVYKRIIAASFIGAVYVILTVYVGREFMTFFIVKFSVSVLMLMVSFDIKGIIANIRVILCFYIISLIMVGIMTALYYLIYDRLTVNAIVLSLFVGYAALHFFFREIKARIDKNNYMRTVVINVGSLSSTLKAFIDTGNELSDPMTKKPVIVVNIESLRNILSEELYCNILRFYENKDDNFESLLSGSNNYNLRIIRYDTISSKGEMMVVFTPDNIEVKGNGKSISVVDAVIGIYPNKISRKGDYDALLFCKILEWEMNVNELSEVRQKII